MVTHSSILAWKTCGQRSLAGHSPWGHKESDMTEQLTHAQTTLNSSIQLFMQTKRQNKSKLFLVFLSYLQYAVIQKVLLFLPSEMLVPFHFKLSLLTTIVEVTIISLLYSVQFSSVVQSCPTLCDPMNRSTPGLPVHHQLPEFTQTHVHRVSDAIQPSHPLSPSPPAPNPSQHPSLFQ